MNTKFTTASNVVIPDEYFNRIITGNIAFDALLGEGLLPGSLITLSAKHGTGKTQLCLQLLEALNETHCVGYVSNEESVEQLAFTCKRIGTYNVPVANIRTVEDVVECTKDLDVLVVDSFSKLEVDQVSSARKTERIALKEIIAAAKLNKCCVILITHNTKTGQSKGGSQIQHDVDATLYIEKVEDHPTMRRIWFDKNRFGCPQEIVMELSASGYILELQDITPSEPSDGSTSNNRHDAILEYLNDAGAATAGDVAQLLDVEYYRAQSLLRELRAINKINKTGRGIDAEYSIKPVHSAPSALFMA